MLKNYLNNPTFANYRIKYDFLRLYFPFFPAILPVFGKWETMPMHIYTGHYMIEKYNKRQRIFLKMHLQSMANKKSIYDDSNRRY